MADSHPSGKSFLEEESAPFGMTMPPEAEMVTQERACTSPIWYTP